MNGLPERLPQKFGAYVLLRPLGAGGMGEVYLAMSGHRELETLCVVKRLRPALLSQPEHVRRFRHEADLARRLVHGNLAHTHNIGEVDGEVFLVQEFVEGHDASALLEVMAGRRRVLPVPVAAYIASEVARGLSYAHAFENLDLVHRDINPPNVCLNYSGEVKLLDFGIASSNLHGERGGDHQAAGKLWHLAPEQLQPGAKIDRRTDVYALGVVLWELLTQRQVGTSRDNGREVRLPETDGEILLWIARGQHLPPSAFNPEVPPELDAVVAKATSVLPDKRFANADDLRRALASFIPAGVHPEVWLSFAMKELFSPDQERAERRRMIEEARPLLDDDVAPVAKAKSGNLPKVTTGRPAGKEEQRSVWLAPIAVGAVVGLLVLFWLRLATHGRTLPPEPTPAGPSATPTQPAAVQAPVPASPHQPIKPALSAAVAPPSSAPHASVEVKAPHPPGVAVKRGDTSTEALVLAAKPDHLRLAREAFNARNWPRALEEGRRAVAQGGGSEAYAIVGNTYFKMGLFADAEREYEKAITLDPTNPLLRDRLSIARVRAQESKSEKRGAGKEP
jgi:serine/threonine protein kinase